MAMDEVILKFRKRVIFMELNLGSMNFLAIKFASLVIPQAIHVVTECAKEKTVIRATMMNLIRRVEGVKTFYFVILVY
jgi:hypothetical protein